MSRAYRIALLVPAILAVMNLVAIWAAGGPCLPDGSSQGC
jgi:hypothetical protein